MTAHSLTHEEARKSRTRPADRNELLRLGWPQFWLLAGILGGMLALVTLVFFAYLVSR